jgi:hypothetical protein
MITKFDEFLNEEINLKKLIGGAAIGAALVAGTPSCNSTYNPSNPNNIEQHDADTYDFSEYQGKTISNIRYGDSEAYAGDYLIVNFTDGSCMKVYAYKYDMQLGGSKGTHLEEVNFSRYRGKIIKYIRYGNGEGYSGDLLHIYFTDGDQLTVYAYKYTMEIHK